MDINNAKYNKYFLVKEMLETVNVIKNFDVNSVEPFAAQVKNAGKLFLTGEGSSRIFPAKHAITCMKQWGSPFDVSTEGGRQAMEYDLKNHAVFCASNSGKTAEMIDLLNFIKKQNNNVRLGMTAQNDTPFESLCNMTNILTCGWEKAVAATKSVVEQALFHHMLAYELSDKLLPEDGLSKAATAFEHALTNSVDASIIEKASRAKRIYFAGRNNGVAEELTLKTNEITRLPSAYLEGTYAVHGIEEVMNENEIVVVIDPFESEIEKFSQVLEKGVGLTIVAISSKQLNIPTIVVPSCEDFDPYIQLAAGWNLLVEIGLANNIDLDTPVRARKVGNEAKIV